MSFRDTARYAFLALLFFALVPLWLYVVLPNLYLYTPNFKFEANVTSVDNFYNKEIDDFEGEKNSRTAFTYNAKKTNDGNLIVQNKFDVRTLRGEKIITITREYGINPRTGSHIPSLGDKERVGTLFAPKHLKKGQPFTYWHINYDGPAQMQFVAEEKLFGLTVYKYETFYEDVDIDQTQYLTHLPEVGRSLGVTLKPHLTLWVEPVSGYLVKYTDETTASFYDLQRKEIVRPWNKFHNTVIDSSVKNLVDNANAAKITLTLQEKVLPMLLALLGIASCLRVLCAKKLLCITLYMKLKILRGCAFFTVFAGILVILGWIFDVNILKSMLPGLTAMKFPTATAFVLTGINLYLFTKLFDNNEEITELFLPITTFILSLIISMVFISSVLGIKTGIENLFFEEGRNAIKTVSPGSPSYGTIFNFVLVISASLTILASKTHKAYMLKFLGYTIALVGAMAILGYVINVPYLYYYYERLSTAMALHTAILFLLNGICLVILGKTEKNKS